MDAHGTAPKRTIRSDFLVNEIAISVGGGGGGVFLPGPDGETPPSPISPIASILVNIDQILVVRELMIDAVRNKGDLAGIGLAFSGSAAGNPVVHNAIQEIGKAVVASALYAAVGGGGGTVGLIDPNCGGTSYETIPTTFTPVARYGRDIHRVAELGRIRAQLKIAVEAFDKAALTARPQGAEIAAVREKLQGALNSLG